MFHSESEYTKTQIKKKLIYYCLSYSSFQNVLKLVRFL